MKSTLKEDMRDAFFGEVYSLAKKDRNVVMITDDMDAFGLRKFKSDFPERFINIGVAEQNMINVAAGLAICGKKVFTYGICPFVTMRCLEQIKVNLCSMRLPVVIIGVGAGFSFSFDGPTHHGTQDVAIMRALPEISIFNPGDSESARHCAILAYRNKGPVYVRLDKGTFPNLYGKKDNFSKGYKIILPLKQVNIVSTGWMTQRALLAIKGLKEKGVEAGLVDVFRLKPSPGQSFCSEILRNSKMIVTIEETSEIGGLGSLIGELILKQNFLVKLKKMATRDRQFLCYGSREWLLEKNGLSQKSIERFVEKEAKILCS